MVISTVSCDRCKKRKVRCDRAVPCSNCQRQNVVCHVSPISARPRGTPGRVQNKETIQARLARLESLLEDLSQTEANVQVATPETDEARSVREDQKNATGDRLHRYVAGPIWSQLSAQIEGLREILLPDSDDDDGPSPATLPLPQQHDSAPDILLYSNSEIFVVNPESLRHPDLTIRQQLFSIYCDNFDPICKIIHRPTIRWQLQKVKAIPQDNVEEAEAHALLFAIYAAAAITLSDDSYSAIANETRSNSLRRFTFATEYFLSKSRYLESRSIVPLQAFTIYLLVIRDQNPGQRQWALMALAIQLAKGLGLHSAKTTDNFKPLQRELRLRLWHVLRVIELRAALDRGMETVIKSDSYDTPLPTNLNDDDLTDDMDFTPLARQGITDVSFCVIPIECVPLMTTLQSIDLSSPDCRSPEIWRTRLKLVDDHENSMRERFYQYCDDRIPIHWATKYIVTVTSEWCRLLAIRPMSRLNENSVSPPPQASQQVLQRALQSLQAEELFFSTPLAQGFRWYPWVQWHVLAVALVEMCATPEACRDDETWDIVKRAYERQGRLVADTAAGSLWQPVRRLMGKVEGLKQAMTRPYQALPPQAAHADYTNHTFSGNFTQAVLNSGGHSDTTFESSNAYQVGVLPISNDPSMLTGLNDSFFHWDQFVDDMTSLGPTSTWCWNV